MKKFRKIIAFVFSAAIAALSVLPTSSMAVTRADVEAKDPNGDGVITMADVAFMLQCLNGRYIPSDPDELDIDSNGIVTMKDAFIVQAYNAGVL